MSIHEDIQQHIRGVVHDLDGRGVVVLTPATIAHETFDYYGDKEADPHVRYAAVEHYKQMARRILAARFGVDGEENEAHQGDMFSGVLQERYPLRRENGEDGGYKQRALMTDRELLWVADQLDKSADARKEHANGIRAYVKTRSQQTG